MKIGFISTRFAGTDGVSLETLKWADVARRMGHEVCYCAGELYPHLPGAKLVPEFHFEDPEALELSRAAFGTDGPCPGLVGRIERSASSLKGRLHEFVDGFGVDVLVVENALAIPMHVPLGLAIADYIVETGIPTIAHGHDFAWERERFRLNCIGEILDRAFPPNLPSVRHAVINSPAAGALRERLGVEPVVVPNVMDYATPPPPPSRDREEFRRSIGIGPGEVMLLQPTRVVPRKGIELAIELARRLRDAHGIRASLVVTHRAGDEGMEYYTRLVGLAREKGVRLLYVADEMDDTSTWDAYHHADFVTYPSLYEGFGNALLETVYFKKPALVNRYGVYAADIGPLGFDFVEIDGAVTDGAVSGVRRLLEDPSRREAAVEKNYALARRHFSYEVLEGLLEGLIKVLLEDF